MVSLITLYIQLVVNLYMNIEGMMEMVGEEEDDDAFASCDEDENKLKRFRKKSEDQY